MRWFDKKKEETVYNGFLIENNIRRGVVGAAGSVVKYLAGLDQSKTFL